FTESVEPSTTITIDSVTMVEKWSQLWGKKIDISCTYLGYRKREPGRGAAPGDYEERFKEEFLSEVYLCFNLQSMPVDCEQRSLNCMQSVIFPPFWDPMWEPKDFMSNFDVPLVMTSYLEVSWYQHYLSEATSEPHTIDGEKWVIGNFYPSRCALTNFHPIPLEVRKKAASFDSDLNGIDQKLTENWPSVNPNENFEFWKQHYLKFGVLYLADERVNTPNKEVSSNGINLENFVQLIEKRFKIRVSLRCANKTEVSYLKDIIFCYDRDFELMDCFGMGTYCGETINLFMKKERKIKKKK
ncbi:hypothetical protein B4U80_13434, partial [Leptotrombidium deliense]